MSSALRGLAALLLAVAVPAHAAPLLFHEHGHGLAFSADGRALFAPSQAGLAIYRDGAWSDASVASDGAPIEAFSGFAVTESAVYSSGYSERHAAGRKPVGLLASRDGGATWRAVALAGEADFRLLAASYHSNAIYVLNTRPNSAMPDPGLYMTPDGRTWRRAALRGLKGEIHGLSAHPRQPGTVAVATGNGLFLSRDEGQNFVALDVREPVTAVAFDLHGDRIRYAHTLANEIIDVGLANRKRRVLRLPPLKGDYVTCLAQNPRDEGVFAFATRRRASISPATAVSPGGSLRAKARRRTRIRRARRNSRGALRFHSGGPARGFSCRLCKRLPASSHAATEPLNSARGLLRAPR